jgi:hypothetical protein
MGNIRSIRFEVRSDAFRKPELPQASEEASESEGCKGWKEVIEKTSRDLCLLKFLTMGDRN